jgi:hypothetical protein
VHKAPSAFYPGGVFDHPEDLEVCDIGPCPTIEARWKQMEEIIEVAIQLFEPDDVHPLKGDVMGDDPEIPKRGERSKVMFGLVSNILPRRRLGV